MSGSELESLFGRAEIFTDETPVVTPLPPDNALGL